MNLAEQKCRTSVGGLTSAVGSRSWELDMPGNWLETGFDLTGDGDFGDTDEVQDRTHNLANELLTASKAFEPFSSALTYDPSGNLKQETRTIPGTPLPTQYDVDFVHDAWNRLVSVTRQPGSVLRGCTSTTG
ncbi:MAG: hypothetical protein KF757_05605 [Phycisphaeraceae bacterium]|nr:hypothetical protein [Phycisphaeraceae bacterium]MCW5763648.1 hypothetical protein [Phycisphaeraceae bacterium]